MKTLMPAAIRCSLMFAAVTALSLVYPTSVHAVPTTYEYTGNPFTDVPGVYTTSDFVTAMITLASPLAPNFSGSVSPTAFTFFDGVQTITNLNFTFSTFIFETDATGAIRFWFVAASSGVAIIIETRSMIGFVEDRAQAHRSSIATNHATPGTWVVVGAVPDTGSTLSLMTLTLMALGLVAKRFQRAAD